jgi:hypothetical protein
MSLNGLEPLPRHSLVYFCFSCFFDSHKDQKREKRGEPQKPEKRAIRRAADKPLEPLSGISLSAAKLSPRLRKPERRPATETTVAAKPTSRESASRSEKSQKTTHTSINQKFAQKKPETASSRLNKPLRQTLQTFTSKHHRSERNQKMRSNTKETPQISRYHKKYKSHTGRFNVIPLKIASGDNPDLKEAILYS